MELGIGSMGFTYLIISEDLFGRCPMISKLEYGHFSIRLTEASAKLPINITYNKESLSQQKPTHATSRVGVHLTSNPLI